mmetsp:Transcript_28885/g.43621  ORF Transcript_28885/g.43621 Transcript_28885/m.43621 type:complete len:159 (+) Transcript_28885:276-752(+)
MTIGASDSQLNFDESVQQAAEEFRDINFTPRQEGKTKRTADLTLSEKVNSSSGRQRLDFSTSQNIHQVKRKALFTVADTKQEGSDGSSPSKFASGNFADLTLPEEQPLVRPLLLDEIPEAEWHLEQATSKGPSLKASLVQPSGSKKMQMMHLDFETLN